MRVREIADKNTAYKKVRLYFNFKDLGGYSQNFLCKFLKISVTLGLNILVFLKTESSVSKQILLKVDVTYNKNDKKPNFYVQLALKSNLKLRKF